MRISVKRIVVSLLLLVVMLSAAQAQTARYAFFSYQRVYNSLPQAQQAQQKIADLRKQYDDEAQKAAKEFNEKYEDFLEGQHTFAPAIYKKRQLELQELMDRNVAFRQECDQQLSQKQESLKQELDAKISAVVKTIGEERQYAFVLNSDAHGLEYSDPVLCDDITDLIIERIK